MPVPVWLYVLSQLPLLASVTGYEIYYFMKIIPIVLVIWVSWPVIKRYIRQPLSRFSAEPVIHAGMKSSWFQGIA